MATRSRPTTPESAVLYACLALLRLRSVPCWRNNTGAFRVEGRFIRAGHKGSSDILGVIPRGPKRGCLLACECKRPGGKPTADQVAFLDSVTAAGAVGVVVDDVRVLAGILDEMGV